MIMAGSAAHGNGDMPVSSVTGDGETVPPVVRDVLPIPDTKHVGVTTYDAKDPNTKYPPITMLRPPAGAPNVLIVLLDDVGFGASSAFGSPCNTPAAERLAAGGLKLNRFHTTAVCSPTRAALLTGRNHHSVGMGATTEMATSAPGNNTIRPKDKAPLAETLKLKAPRHARHRDHRLRAAAGGPRLARSSPHDWLSGASCGWLHQVPG
jgi:hypothetical protein